jgi:gas vesicle protein
VDYASGKITNFGSEVSKKAMEYADMAKEQLQEIKETINDENEESLSSEPDEQ